MLNSILNLRSYYGKIYAFMELLYIFHDILEIYKCKLMFFYTICYIIFEIDSTK